MMADTSTERTQRDLVLDVAAMLFAEQGVDDVTMADIASTAGVARATVFNYFGSKHALVVAITETVLDFYRAMLDEALADDTTPTPRLVRSLCESMGIGIERQRELFQGVFREIARIQLGLDESDVAQQANEDTRVRLVRLVQRGQERGELNDELSAEAVAGAFHSLVNGTITGWLYADVSESLTDRMRAAADVFLSPVESPAPRRRRTTSSKGVQR
jgi:AcrR family transcriptional regulator